MFWNSPKNERFEDAPEIRVGDIVVTNEEKVFEGFPCVEMAKKANL